MFQSKVVAVALILLLGGAMTEIRAKSISKRHVRHDWLIIPDAIAFYTYEFVNKVSPTAAAALVELAQTPFILDARNLLIKETSKMNMAAQQLLEKMSAFWTEKKKELVQQ